MVGKKKVFLIYEFLSEQGGLEREIINHANFLKDSGYDVKVLTCYFDKKILEQLPFGDIKIESIGKFNTGVEWLDMALCGLGFHNLKIYNPDAFLVYSFPANFLTRKKKTLKINYVNHFLHAIHMSWKEKLEWASGTQGMKRWVSVIGSLFLGDWVERLDKKLVRKNDLIFMNSGFTKKRLDKIYGLKNTIVSYPPLDPRFDNPSKKKMKDKFVFSSSRIIPDKKYEWLIESMNLMKHKLPLYLAGSVEDNYKKSLLDLASQKKVEIKFLGRLNTEEIKDYYTNAQVFAYPTPEEDFGLVPVESMACGTPVVVWGDGAGPTEQVIDGKTGYYAKPYDKKDFAAKMDKVIDTGMKRKNRARIINSAKKFSAGEVKKGFMKEVDKLLN